MIEWQVVSRRWENGKEIPTAFGVKVGSFDLRLDVIRSAAAVKPPLARDIPRQLFKADDSDDAKIMALELFAGHCRAAARLACRWHPPAEIEAEAALMALERAGR